MVVDLASVDSNGVLGDGPESFTGSFNMSIVPSKITSHSAILTISITNKTQFSSLFHSVGPWADELDREHDEIAAFFGHGATTQITTWSEAVTW